MISQDTMKFLKQLHKNNTSKEWFHDHQPSYKKARKEYKEFMNQFGQGIATFDKEIEPAPGAPVHIFRINNDIRFNPSRPIYKSNFAGEISKNTTDTKAGYYLFIQPGNKSFFGGGIHMPPNDILTPIRQSIADEPKKLEKVLQDKKFKSIFEDLDRSITLKNMPRDFTDVEHHQDLIKLKSFHTGIDLSDELVTSPALMANLLDYAKAIHPLIAWLNRAVQSKRDES